MTPDNVCEAIVYGVFRGVIFGICICLVSYVIARVALWIIDRRRK